MFAQRLARYLGVPPALLPFHSNYIITQRFKSRARGPYYKKALYDYTPTLLENIRLHSGRQ